VVHHGEEHLKPTEVHDGAIIGSGLGVGIVFGLFGAGGSAFATPVLSLAGVPGVLAVASPLPAMVPAALAGARRHVRAGTLDRSTARWSVAGGLPGAVLGSLVWCRDPHSAPRWPSESRPPSPAASSAGCSWSSPPGS
jgi:uncharacterized membrane protein YfcA